MRYVGSEEFKLLLRTGPGVERKIIDMISIGEQMEMLEDGEEWVRVRLQDGKEGWVLKRYLSSEKPSKLVLQGLQQTYQRLSATADELSQENETLKATNAEIKASLEEKTQALEELTRSYNELKQDSDASSFQMRKYLVFFFSGAGILFIGLLLGLVMKRQRRKSMYMI
jgi:SH3 domain protein